MEITRSVEAPKITWLMHEEPASLLLSFAAGFSDTAGFIALGGLFTAHITGSFVLVGAAIVNGTGGILARLLMIPVFIIAVAVVAAFSVYAKRRKLPTIPVLMVSEAMFLALFCTVGVALTPQQQFTFSDSAVFLIGACGVIAMGIQNALMRIELNTLLPTTIMTGNSTQFIIDLVYVLSEYNRTHGHLSADMAARAKKLRRYWVRFARICWGSSGRSIRYCHLALLEHPDPLLNHRSPRRGLDSQRPRCETCSSSKEQSFLNFPLTVFLGLILAHKGLHASFRQERADGIKDSRYSHQDHQRKKRQTKTSTRTLHQ